MSVKKTLKKDIKILTNKYLDSLSDEGLDISKAYIFGSYARKTYSANSDIDICIISTDFEKKNYDLENVLWLKTLDIDTRIEPVGFTPDDFIDENPLAYEIKKHGLRIR